MTTRTVSRMFPSYDDAVQIVYDLEQAGIVPTDISLIGSAADPRLSPAINHDPAQSQIRRGAAIGATAVGGVGVLAGLGAIVIPGLGPLVAAGWFAAGLAGAVTGAAAGGLVGALTKLGVSHDQAHRSAEELQQGGTLVLVRAAPDELGKVESILRRDYRAVPAWVEEEGLVADTATAETVAVPAAFAPSPAAERQRIQRGIDRINAWE